ncbi:MAG: hypothetical protein AB2L14_05635 [Candidatus Xenobiia bacterium LiM19]
MFKKLRIRHLELICRLVEASLRKTPADPKALLKAMQKAGWSTDLLRSCDEGMWATWEGTPDEEELQAVLM